MKTLSINSKETPAGRLHLYENRELYDNEKSRLYLVLYEQTGRNEKIMGKYRENMYNSAIEFLNIESDRNSFLRILGRMMESQMDYFFWGNEIFGAAILLQEGNTLTGWTYGTLYFKKKSRNEKNPDALFHYQNGEAKKLTPLKLETAENDRLADPDKENEPEVSQDTPVVSAEWGSRITGAIDTLKKKYGANLLRNLGGLAFIILIMYIVYVVITELLINLSAN